PSEATVLTVIDNEDPDPKWLSISAVDPWAVETPADPGRFRVSRTGDTSNPVVVSYYSAGTATPQVDFTGLPDYNSVTNEAQVTTPAGQSWVEFAINPVADGVTEGTETAKIALLPPPGYAVRNPNFAIVNVLDDSRPTVTIQATDDYAFEEG